MAKSDDDFVKHDLQLLHDTANNVDAGRQPVCRIDEVREMIELDRPLRQAMAVLSPVMPLRTLAGPR